MKISFLLSGRILYGISIVAFGLLCLVYVDFLNSLQPVPSWVPGYAALAVIVGLVLLFAGIGITANVKTIPAALALAGLLALGVVLLLIPSAFTNPELLRSPWWIRTFETVALAGAAVVLAGLTAGRVAWVRAGRIAFGISLPVFGVLHFVYPQSVADLIALSPVRYPWPIFWAYLTGAGHFFAGIAIASAMYGRLAAILAGLMYASWALTLHLPRIIDNPETYSGDRPELTSLFVCVAFWGGAWIVAGGSAKRET